MTFLSHWIPTFAGAAVLAVAGLILRAINRRKDTVPLPRPPRLRSETREGHTGT
jgi:hypothetical protein